MHPNKTIGIFTYPVPIVKPWDPDKVASGITGSEEAVIYMSQELAKLGYKVTVIGDPPKNSLHTHPSANPRYVNYEFNDSTMFDIVVAWRNVAEAELLKKRGHQVYFWPHDVSNDPIADKFVNGFDDVLWLSEWQRKQWISVNPTFAKFKNVFGNGINIEDFRPIKERENPYSCIWGSDYGRGLDILLDIWLTIKVLFPRATLDIYYGWPAMLTAQKEKRVRAQIADLAKLDVREHGRVGHDELNRAYENASLWTYPTTFDETFCITALRAQYAGSIPVIVERAALRETVRFGYRCRNYEDYLSTLTKAMLEIEKINISERDKMKEFIRQDFTWEKLALKWDAFFNRA